MAGDTWIEELEDGQVVDATYAVQRKTRRRKRDDGRLHLELHDLEKLAPGDALELLPGARRDAETLDGMVEFLAGEIHHPGLAALVGRFLGDAPFRARFRTAPAAETHHAYAGGLLEHTVAVAAICRETAQLHPRLNGDQLLSAALLHDVGR